MKPPSAKPYTGTIALRSPFFNPIEVNVEEENWQPLKVEGKGPIEVGVKLHKEAGTQSWDPLEKNITVIGAGPFARSPFYGTNRMVVLFKSPMTYTLHVSACGGVGFEFVRSGTNLVVIKGKSEKKKVIVVEGDESGIKDVKFYPVNEDVYTYSDLFGTFAISKYMWDRFGPGRGIAVGPFALRSRTASLASIEIVHGHPSPFAVDLFGRGGGGSVLARVHGVLGIFAKGSYEPPKLPSTLPDEISMEVFGEPYVSVVLKATTKYRYDPKYKSGGTFGVNYPHYRDLIPTFAFNSIYFSDQVRIMISNMILKYFWKPFQEETIKRRQFGGCGDPCPAACKKVWRGVKVDYEPSNAMGPLIGIFRLDLTVKLIEMVDSYGADAIETGHALAWIMDSVRHGLLRPEDLGIEEVPNFDPLSFDPIEDSERNFKIAKKLLEDYLNGKGIMGEVAEKGIRMSAKEFNERFGAKEVRFEDLAVYVAFGERGYMTPNLYWAPGMVAPLYVLGRYWTNYRPTIDEPEKFAKSSLRRALKELMVDNAGICRFHRRWAEKALPLMYEKVVGEKVDDEYAKEIYKEIALYSREAKAEPVPWEGRKTKDIVATMAKRLLPEWYGREYEWWRIFKETIDRELGL